MFYNNKRTSKLFFLIVLLCYCLTFNALSQDSILQKTIVKKGWSLGVLPIYRYSSDFGSSVSCSFKFYDYGDGTIYPDYKHLLLFSFSRSFLGPTMATLKYDSKTLIDGFRLTGAVGYLSLPAATFYGYNGNEAPVYSEYVTTGDSLYKTSMYYRYHKKITRVQLNIIKNFDENDLKLVVGGAFLGINCEPFKVDRYNDKVDSDSELPDIESQSGLLGDMVSWGVIKENEKDGGNHLQLKIGSAFDTRDFEPNPMRGMYTEAIIIGNKSLESPAYDFVCLGFTHRHYLTVVPERMNFIYRIGVQHKLVGNVPYYMAPYIYQAYRSNMLGLGGGNSLRGIPSARIIGDGYFYGGAETRLKLFKTTLLKQNLYLGASAFTDFGMVTQKHKIEGNQQEVVDYLAAGSKEKLHASYGGAGHVVFNENFIISFTYGRAFDNNSDGFYIGLDYNY